MSGTKRSYQLKKRAHGQEETRLRIVEATMRLHETIGPRATTISAIAEAAGVQRLTVYRHFSDETAVFQACTAHWLGLHPPPDPATWAGLGGMERLRAALGAFYAYYGVTRRMWTVSFRDVDDVPALRAPMAEVAAFMAGVGADLVSSLARSGPAIVATVNHALHFLTWRDLDERGVDDAAKVGLACAWVDGGAGALE
ncbi:TetR/AcrR family transcriptional regulator [Zavarzinia compransoris]|uniref:TetR/AcrR family transcriptional regulator n=1 Tax=Zavarzinia marina TaxID=2911065 RepID=UPI001F29300A|nr:TetR/AcrR family transcriptional regulator [Zavarzinia marina]MCF4167087.1 TetR/AcrR family transcriptional regulator [Zavarzinia marina]